MQPTIGPDPGVRLTWRARRRLRPLHLMAVVAITAIALTTAWSPPAGAQTTATPPPQPAPGQLGGEGPCGQSVQSWTNLGSLLQTVWVYQPTGGGAPRTGGSCGDASRPVVFFAHGYGAIFPQPYDGLIDNLVSNGNIVVYANYSVLAAPALAYGQVDNGIVEAASRTPRMDLDNIGFFGHSYGAGMTPYLVQRADARGWGSASLWFQMNASFYAFQIGSGPIAMPAHARGLVISHQDDANLDARIGIEVFEDLQLPDAQKEHVTVRTDCHQGSCVVADHTLSSSSGENHLWFYGVFRNWQVLSDCARTGANCNADLTFMGTWSDGHPATPAIATDDPVDSGPPTSAECNSPLWALLGNTRGCP